MKKLLKNLNNFILPKTDKFRLTPYIWLIYLSIFFISLAAYHPVKYSYIYATIGTVFFLVVYFNSYQVESRKIQWNILAILLIGTLMSQLTPGASVFFVFSAAFCCRLGNAKKALTWLIFIALWVGFISWYFHYSVFFYLPAIMFTFIIGGINIYEHDISLNQKELILSQQEVRHLARTSERERIARDLHDLIGHTFSVITLKAELAAKLIDKNNDKAKKEIVELENISRDALKQIREVVTGYRASDLSTELAHAKYVLESNDISFDYQFDDIALDEHINKELAIILKELVTNILKHARASIVTCIINLQKDSILLSIKDDGIGFSEKKIQGFGIKGIHERIEKLSGKVSIDASEGTSILIKIPGKSQL